MVPAGGRRGRSGRLGAGTLSDRSSTVSTTARSRAPTIRPIPSRPVKNLLTVDNDFESWSALSKKFFDEEAGVITKIILDSGKGA